VVAATEKMLLKDPSNENWRLVLADAQVHLGTVETRLHRSGDSRPLAAKGIATLQAIAKKPEASPMTLDQAASDLLHVEPASLQDPEFAVHCAERAVELSHSQSPSRLFTLAQAFRAAGEVEKSRAVASEALALLPAPPPDGSKSNLRKLLELEVQPGK